MFVLVFYDVPVGRTEKYKQVLHRHLDHTQNSVFSGVIQPSKLQNLKEALRKLFEPGDEVCLFEVANRHNIEKNEITIDGRGSAVFSRQRDHEGESQVC